MMNPSELKPGMVIRSEGQTYKVLAVESKRGPAKMGGVVKGDVERCSAGGLRLAQLPPGIGPAK